MIKKKKILFFLSIGWYPQNQNKQVKKDITLVRKSSEKMAALVENNQFCYQGVTETDMDERRMNAQEDEKQRRTVKTIVRYRESGAWGEKDFREDCGGRIRRPDNQGTSDGSKCDIKPYEIRKISELCA